MKTAFALEDYPLLFITDRKRSGGRSNPEVIHDVLEGGARWVMYHEPDLPDREFYREAVKIKEMCEHVGAGLIINNRLDIAALIRADGIHLGQNDLPVRVVKEFMGEDFIVGYSAHTEEEALTIKWEGANYITYSPIFTLDHKDSPYEPHGIKGAQNIHDKFDQPIFLLGGIRLMHLEEMVGQIPRCKIAGVSMISEAENIIETIEQCLVILHAPRDE